MIRRTRFAVVATLVAATLIVTSSPATAADIRLGYHSPTASPDGSIAYFAGYATGKGVELYKTDGTASGTVLVKDINSGKRNAFLANLGSSKFAQFTYLDDDVYFFATDSTGRNLWVSDGTAAGTKRLSTAGASRSFTREIVAFEGAIYFSGYSKLGGYEIWKSDGTAQGTALAFDTAPNRKHGKYTEIRSGSPQSFRVVDDKLFVFAGTDVDLPGIYVIKDDTITLLKKVADYGDSKAEISSIAVDGELYWSDAGALWRTDGTVEGTQSVGVRGYGFQPLDDATYFAGGTGATYGIWKMTDGVPVFVDAIPWGPVWNLSTAGGKVSILTWDQSTRVVALWVKADAESPLVKIKEIYTSLPYPGAYKPVSIDGKLYFSSTKGLWESDGTADGTKLVKDFAFSKPLLAAMELAVVGGTIIGTGVDRYKHSALWLSDGTTDGTYQRLATGVMTGASPAITGSAAPGSTLTGKVGKWTPAPTSWKYQWKIDGVPVEGANSLTFVVPDVAIGSKVQLTVTGFRSGYQTVNRTSQAKVTVGAFDAPVPTISGTLAVGELLTVDPGTWTPAATLSYQWYANGKIIAGKTGTTYQLTTRSVLRSITVTVTGKKAGYATLTRTSLPAQ